MKSQVEGRKSLYSVTEPVESLCKPSAEASLLGYAEAKPKILKCPE